MNLPSQLELATLAATLPPTGDAEARVREALALWYASGVMLAKEAENQRTRRPLADVLAEVLPAPIRAKDRDLLYREFRESRAGKRIADLLKAKAAIANEKQAGVTAEDVLLIQRELPAWVAERKAKALKARGIKGGKARAAKKATARKK